MIITRSPFRCSFFGGGTDYPQWFKNHKGAVLATTIDKFAHIMVRRLPPNFLQRYRIVYREEEYVDSVEEIKHPVIREGIKFSGIKDPLEVLHWSDMPARKGMGTSSAFTVGLLRALDCNGYQNAFKIENDILQRKLGYQDVMMAAIGGFLHIQFPSMEVDSIDYGDLHKYLMLFDTGHYRDAVEVVKTYQFEEKTLTQMYNLVGYALNYLKERNYIAFGRLLDKTWQLKKRLSPMISNDIVDQMYNIALSNGAVGGKVLGAGGGGYLLIFADPKYHSQIRIALRDYKHVAFKFWNKGCEVMYGFNTR